MQKKAKMSNIDQQIRVAKLLGKLQQRVITQSEEEELRLLLQRCKLDVDTLCDSIEKNETMREETAVVKNDRLWQKIESQIRWKSRFTNLLYYSSIAAMLTLLIGYGVIGDFIVDRPPSEMNYQAYNFTPQTAYILDESGEKTEIQSKEIIPFKLKGGDYKQKKIVNPFGATSHFFLADSTEVILYPNSELTLIAERREVILSGEAFFRVKKKNDGSSFSIIANNQLVEVLGTTLNVRQYPKDQALEVALLTGKIEVCGVGVSPLHRIVMTNEKSYKIDRIEAKDYYNRAQGKFSFRDEALVDILEELQLWYDFDFEFKDDTLKQKRFTLQSPRGESIIKVLDLLSLTGELKIIAQKDKLLQIEEI